MLLVVIACQLGQDLQMILTILLRTKVRIHRERLALGFTIVAPGMAISNSVNISKNLKLMLNTKNLSE